MVVRRFFEQILATATRHASNQVGLSYREGICYFVLHDLPSATRLALIPRGTSLEWFPHRQLDLPKISELIHYLHDDDRLELVAVETDQDLEDKTLVLLKLAGIAVERLTG